MDGAADGRMHLGGTHRELRSEAWVGPFNPVAGREFEHHHDVLGLEGHTILYSRFANRARSLR